MVVEHVLGGRKVTVRLDLPDELVSRGDNIDEVTGTEAEAEDTMTVEVLQEGGIILMQLWELKHLFCLVL